MVDLDRSIRVPGATIRYADVAGREPAVVLLHGAGADHEMFEAQASAIAAEQGRRVVLLDLRGHGRSRPNALRTRAELLVADVSTLIAHLGLDRPVVAGHSLGGNLAQALVRRRPEAFAGLVVMDSTWSTGPLGRGERMLLRLAAPALALIPDSRLPRVMAEASAVTPAARADAERAFAQMSKKEFLAAWRATVEFVAPDPSYRTAVPLLLVRGDRDRTGNIRTAMPAWAAAEGVAEVVVPGAGHLVTQDAPAAVTAALLGFLAGRAPTRPAPA